MDTEILEDFKGLTDAAIEDIATGVGVNFRSSVVGCLDDDDTMLGDGEEEAGAGLGDDVSLLESGRDVEICLDGVTTGVDVTLVNILKEVTTVLAEGEAGPGVELGLGREVEAGLNDVAAGMLAEREAGPGVELGLVEIGREVEAGLNDVAAGMLAEREAGPGVELGLVEIGREVEAGLNDVAAGMLAEREAGPGVELGLVEIGREVEAGLNDVAAGMLAEREAGPGVGLGLVEIGRGVEAGLNDVAAGMLAEREAGPGVELGLVEIGREVEAGLDAEGEAGPGVELGLVEIGRELEAGLDDVAAAGIAELVEEAGVMAEDVGAAHTAWQGGDVAGYVSTHITLPALPALVYTVPQAEPVKPTLQEQFPPLVHTLNTNTSY